MAYLLEIAIVDEGDDKIKVVHQFFGLTRAEVETYKREHLESCEYFHAALEDERTLETLDEIPDSSLPTEEDYEG